MKKIGFGVMIGLVLACAAVWPVPVAAQNQFEENRQAERDFAIADAHLNQVYKRLMSKLDQASQAKLKKTQRTWIVFRDAEADFQADRVARGGSMAPMIYAGTQAEETKTRTRDLQRTLKDQMP